MGFTLQFLKGCSQPKLTGVPISRLCAKKQRLNELSFVNNYKYLRRSLLRARLRFRLITCSDFKVCKEI